MINSGFKKNFLFFKLSWGSVCCDRSKEYHLFINFFPKLNLSFDLQ